MTRYLWTIPALLLSLTMRPGVRYGLTSFRWAVLRACILERDGHRCRECGRVMEWNVWLQVHHKRPVSRGGGYGPGNLISLCKTCHEGRHR